MRGLTGLVLAFGALLVVTGAAAGPRLVPGERAALAAVRHAVAAGRLSRTAAAVDRREIARAVHLVRVLPAGRREHVMVALEQAGALGKRLTAPRALAVFGQLHANDDYFARHAAPRPGTDITDADGIVYRYFAGRCLEFHPLAEFSALNARALAKDVAGTQRLAAALAARAVPRNGGGNAWEYYFAFGGSPPWVSGMAQAVAAQGFARAAALVPEQSAAWLREATGAFRAISRLMTKVPAGPWIRLYSFKSTPVLNAQLQSVLSLQTYAKAADDSTAAALADRMELAAAATVQRFDTGYWSYYSLAGNPTPLSYQRYVVRLLRKLAPADLRFARAADRFAAYLRQPAAFQLANAPVGELRFWLSKPATVTATTAAGRTVRLRLLAGWHTFSWKPKRVAFYAVRVTAVDYAGNRASFSALPLLRVATTGDASPRAGQTRAATATQPFAAGIGIDDSGQAPLAGSLGLRPVRMGVAWESGQTAPQPSVVASLQSLPSASGLMLELGADQLPTDDAGRAALAHFAASLAQQTPALQDIVLAPAPSVASASSYADALAAVRAAVAAVSNDVAVGPALDGSVQPQRTALAVAQELAHDGADADLVSFRPAPASGGSAWAVGDVGKLESALAKSLGTAPPVLVDAFATATTVPSSERAGYTGGLPPTAGAVAPATQASTYAGALRAASCLPGVSGLLLDRLVDDGATPQPATGLYYAGGHAKPSAAAVKQAIRTVARGAVICPGLSARVTPTTLTFPESLSTSSPASVAVGCNRDCLYLVTLDGANGQPVVASRGALIGGAPAKTITLSKRTLRPGGYRVDVRLVSRVDPGPVMQRRSALLTVG